jgi:hypothetical protein
MFWGDFIKFIRSAVFKNELENGNFKVKKAVKAVEDENGENLSSFISEAKRHINAIVDAANSIGSLKLEGYAFSKSTAEYGGYPVTINFNLGSGYSTTFTANLLEYSGFSNRPAIIISDGNIEVFGYAATARKECSAIVEYTRKINYIE